MTSIRNVRLLFVMGVLFFSLVPLQASGQVSDYNVCDFNYAPLRTTDSSEYYDTLDCEYTAIGDYEVWDDYRIKYISSSSHYQYYVYVDSDMEHGTLELRLEEYSDDWDNEEFDVDLAVLDPSNIEIARSENGPDMVDSLSITLEETGFYKIHVERYSGGGEFQLTRKITENKGPTGSLVMFAPNENLYLHELLTFDACDSYDVGGGSVYYSWEIDGESLRHSDCELPIALHDTGSHEICVSVADYYGKGFEDCEYVSASDPFGGVAFDWEESEYIQFSEDNVITLWDRSGLYKAPGIDFWFRLGMKNEYKIETEGSWDISTKSNWVGDNVTTSFSIQDISTTHDVFLRPSMTFEYYSSDTGWQTLDIPLASSEPVYPGQPSFSFQGMVVYYWDGFVEISDSSDMEDYSDSNAFVLGTSVTLSEVDLYPLVRQMLESLTTGVTGASTFLDLLEDWSGVSIPLSYEMAIGLAGIEYSGLLIKPIIEGDTINVEQFHGTYFEDYEDSEQLHIGQDLEVYEVALARISDNSDMSDLSEYFPSSIMIETHDSDFNDVVEFRVAHYSDLLIYNYQDPYISIGVSSNFGSQFWTLWEFDEAESYIHSRTVSDSNNLYRTSHDTDGDGVIEVNDECYETPEGIDVLDDGCPKKLIDRLMTGQGDMTPVYGAGGGILLVLFLALFMMVTASRRSKSKSKSSVGLFDGGYSEPFYGFDSPALLPGLAPAQISADLPFHASQAPSGPMTPAPQPLAHDNYAMSYSEPISPMAYEPEPIQPEPQPVDQSVHPHIDMKGVVDSTGTEWLDYNDRWWWRTSPANYWAQYDD